MYKQIKKIVFLAASTSIMSLSLSQVSIAAPKGFKTPSGNMGSSRDKGKMGHVENKCCRNQFSDLLTCPKMVKKHSTFAH